MDAEVLHAGVHTTIHFEKISHIDTTVAQLSPRAHTDLKQQKASAHLIK